MTRVLTIALLGYLSIAAIRASDSEFHGILPFSNVKPADTAVNSYLAPDDHTARTAKPSDIIQFGCTMNRDVILRVQEIFRSNYVSYGSDRHLGAYSIWLEKRYAIKAKSLISENQKMDPSLLDFGINDKEIEKIHKLPQLPSESN